ncbi:hypothetical protein SMC26_35480 [Actinomadura fulvescens]|uniref:Secreted protein n=1 Tax=Actinomadura fulvescens TaxID=46160 RepID=A0ABP6D0A4_9ACTN
MMKRLAATGMMTLCAGAVLMGATPALAGDEGGDGNENNQIVGILTCRDVNVSLIVTIDDILSKTTDKGDCNNGSANDDSGHEHSGDDGNGNNFHHDRD